MLKISNLAFVLLIALFGFWGCNSSKVINQETEDLKDFKIIIEQKQDKIKLKGIEGTAWTDLSFSIKNNQTKRINNLGMCETKNTPASGSYFQISITKTNKGIRLDAKRGTAWTELSFSLNDYQKKAINQLGMSSLN